MNKRNNIRAFINCNIIDGKFEKDTVRKGTILVETADGKGKIKFVGNKDEVSIPNNCKIVDLKDKYVLPGLINAHAHLFGDGSPTSPEQLKRTPDENLEYMKSSLGKHLIKETMKKMQWRHFMQE